MPREPDQRPRIACLERDLRRETRARAGVVEVGTQAAAARKGDQRPVSQRGQPDRVPVGERVAWADDGDDRLVGDDLRLDAGRRWRG